MKQFLLPRRYAGGPRLTLTGGDYRYLARVLRMRAGDTLPAVDAGGGRHLVTLLSVDEASCDVSVQPAALPEAPSTTPPEAAAQITLLQCLPKGRKIDLIVRQATEAGVGRIVLVASEHSVVKPADDDDRRKRLVRIAREALQQSGAPRLPVIEGPRTLASIATGGEDWGTAVFFHEKQRGGVSLHGLLAGRPSRVAALVGPEGGLSDGEAQALEKAGFAPVHLGPRVLRVETAATYALGAMITILQERDSWIPAPFQ
jgi:16S rRNA (uracil1498-N3)-methyltransferase